MDCIGRLDRTDETQVLEYSLQIGGRGAILRSAACRAEGDKVLSIVRD